MVKRITVGVLGIPLLLFVILSPFRNNLPFLLFLLIINSLGLNELYNIFLLKKIKINRIYFISCGIMMVLGLYLQIHYLKNMDFNLFDLIFILSVCIYFISLIIKKDFHDSISRISYFTFGLFYVSYLSGYFLMLKSLPEGSYYLFLIVMLIWFNDSFACFGGLWLGKKKLGLAASPKKSLAGVYSGIIFSIVSVFICELIFREHLTLSLSQKILIGIVFGFIVILSDLMESVLKRSAGIKDSGHLFPGHGGVLDIFDSWFLTIPLFYFYLRVSGIV